MEKVTCKKCGSDNLRTSKYCYGCGFELPKTESFNLNNKVEIKAITKESKKKQMVATIIGVIAFGISSFAIQQIFFKAPSFDKAMMEAASEINKTCPVMIDSETRLDNTFALPGNIFQYNYTLVNIEKANADTIGMKNFLEPQIISNVKTNPQMKFQRDNNTTLNYFYKDKNGMYLFIVSVTPEKYK